MSKRSSGWVLVLVLAFTASGCATTSNSRGYQQSDIDSLNSKISSLQAQLAQKDSQISKLENQMQQDGSARAQAESESRDLARRVQSLQSELDAALRASAAAKRPASTDSDLK